jgi:hypothetical protein
MQDTNRRPRSVHYYAPLPMRPRSARSRRRIAAAKALLLAATALVVSTAHAWTLAGFLYGCAAILFTASFVVFGMLFHLLVGFRAFERRIDRIARRFLRPPRRLALSVFVGGRKIDEAEVERGR